jgi:hypothetical protein
MNGFYQYKYERKKLHTEKKYWVSQLGWGERGKIGTYF